MSNIRLDSNEIVALGQLIAQDIYFNTERCDLIYYHSLIYQVYVSIAHYRNLDLCSNQDTVGD